jgi:hypothetical protein
MTLVFGVEIADMPENYIATEAVVILKCMDDAGEVFLLLRNSDTLRSWDRIGLLTCALDLAREDGKSGFTSGEGDG